MEQCVSRIRRRADFNRTIRWLPVGYAKSRVSVLFDPGDRVGRVFVISLDGQCDRCRAVFWIIGLLSNVVPTNLERLFQFLTT